MDYFYQTSDSAPRFYPVIQIFENFFRDDDDQEGILIHRRNNLKSDWGEVSAPFVIGERKRPIPKTLGVAWLSVVEAKCYWIEEDIDKKQIEKDIILKDKKNNSLFNYIVTGLAPYGGVALWLRGEKKSKLIQWMKAEEVDPYDDDFSDFFAMCSPKQTCDDYLKKDELVKQNIVERGLPSVDFFDNWMKQHRYRYIGLEEYFDGEKWQKYDEEDLFFDDLDFDSIQDQRFDGTHDLLHDGGLMKYHEAGCPKRLAVKWHEGRNDFSAYYWFDEQIAPQFFNNFFLMNTECKGDVLLRIDTRASQFDIALKGELLAESQVFPKEAYQLLVFMNGKELYRSENFAQEDGAWNW